jgi:hypothetical protein
MESVHDRDPDFGVLVGDPQLRSRQSRSSVNPDSPRNPTETLIH